MRAKLNLRNLYHRSLASIPFTYGIPVPPGIVQNASEIALLNGSGEPMPVAAEQWATWPNGLIRWALLDFCADFAPSEETTYEIAIGEGIESPLPVNPVVVKETKAAIEVSNGRLTAIFLRKRFKIFHTLAADGTQVVGPNHRCDIVAITPTGKIHRASYDPKPRLSLEHVSPLRTVVRWDGGLFAGDGTRFTEFRCKLTFFANNSYIKVEHSAVNREMPERGVLIGEYRIELETAMEPATTKIVRQKNHGVDYLSRMVELKQNVRLKVPTKGQDLRSEGAVGVLGTVGKVLLEDESAFQETANEYPHFLRPGAPRVAIGGGYAVVFPFLGVRGEQKTFVGSFLRMGPQHPKGIGADENRVTFDVWPAGYGEWRLSRGMTKTHHLAWSFFGSALTAMEYYRSGTYTNYLKLLQQMLHNSTVDVVDWDPDPLRMGGTPYHTDYHQDAVCVTSHTWTEGMFEYAYIAGDRAAFRAAVSLCEWILRWMKGKPHLVKQDGREIGWPILALVAGYKATWDKRYLDACDELVGFYKEKVAQHGELLNSEPPGAEYTLSLYGEYAGWEGLHKLWELTRDEELRTFTLSCMERALTHGHIDVMNPVARSTDMYMIYAGYELSKDPKWLDLAKSFLPIVLTRPNWDGYMYRRIIHYLGLCHAQGWIDDNLVALKA